MQAAGANVFRALVYAECEVRDLVQRFRGEFQLDAFGLQQCRVLLHQGRFRLRQNTNKIFHGERLEFYANGKAALQFRDQVARLGDVEGSRGDEENVIGANHAVTGVDGGAFDDGENVTLHAFARDIGAMAAFASRNLVDLIEEDDA